MSGLQFTPAHVRLIQGGGKTQTRRRVKGDDPARWRKGRTYAVQPGRGRPAMCRVLIVDTIRCDPCKGTGVTPAGADCARCLTVGELAGVRMECLGDLTYEDAMREGYRTRDEYRHAWLRINDRTWLEATESLLACLDQTAEQLLVDDALEWLGWTDRTLLRRLRWLARAGAVQLAGDVWERQENAETIAEDHRWGQRWADTPVWVITFRLDTAHQPRYLAAESDELYVTSAARALPLEPEAVTEHEQKQITSKAGTTFVTFQTQERETRDAERAQATFDERLRVCRYRARSAGVDIDRRLWALEKLIAERRSPAAILNKLQGVERLLDDRKAAA